MSKSKALRNFSGPKGMILKGDIIEVSELYVSDWTSLGLIEPVIEPDPNTFKTMKTKRNVKT
jgi:hypothetical protein